MKPELDTPLTKEETQKRPWWLIGIAIIFLIHVAFFLIYWILNPSLAATTNSYLFNLTHLKIPYVAIILSLFCLVGIWAIVIILSSLKNVSRPLKKTRGRRRAFVCVAIVFLVIFYAVLFIITRLDQSQVSVLMRILDLVRIVTDTALLIFLAILVNIVFTRLLKTNHRLSNKQMPIVVILTLVFAIAWVLPLIFRPAWVYQGEIPAKPKILAHRGASMISPENTLVSLDLAAENGAYGFESDLRTSKDGKQFLMHDDTMKRTTNIAEVYPGRENQLAEDFTFAEIEKLNAGWWFILNDPYKSIKNGLITQEELTEYQAQKVPTLEEVLSAIKQKGLVLMYDLRSPAKTHPFFGKDFELTYDLIKNAKVEDQVWLILEPNQIQRIYQETPGITRVAGVNSGVENSAGFFVDLGYQVINTDKAISREAIHEYQTAGLKVNVYVIDEPWLFSQFWLDGVNSITSNNIHNLKDLKAPVVCLSLTYYVILWSLLGILLVLWILSPWIIKHKPIENHDEENDDQAMNS